MLAVGRSCMRRGALPARELTGLVHDFMSRLEKRFALLQGDSPTVQGFSVGFPCTPQTAISSLSCCHASLTNTNYYLLRFDTN